MRLIAEPAKRRRNPASSSAASSASGGPSPTPPRARVQRRQFGQRRLSPILPRAQLRMAGGTGETVPGADGETIVAAIDAVAEFLAQFMRNRSAMLDGEVGDAACRVQSVGRREGVGRAG